MSERFAQHTTSWSFSLQEYQRESKCFDVPFQLVSYVILVTQFWEDGLAEPDLGAGLERRYEVLQDLGGVLVAPVVEDVPEHVGVRAVRHLVGKEVVAPVLEPALEILGHLSACDNFGQV